MDWNIGNKDLKRGFNVRVDVIVGWGTDRGIGDKYC